MFCIIAHRHLALRGRCRRRCGRRWSRLRLRRRAVRMVLLVLLGCLGERTARHCNDEGGSRQGSLHRVILSLDCSRCVSRYGRSPPRLPVQTAARTHRDRREGTLLDAHQMRLRDFAAYSYAQPVPASTFLRNRRRKACDDLGRHSLLARRPAAIRPGERLSLTRRAGPISTETLQRRKAGSPRWLASGPPHAEDSTQKALG